MCGKIAFVRAETTRHDVVSARTIAHFSPFRGLTRAMRKAWRAWRTRGVKTRSIIERIVRSKPLSEAIVWIKRSVVMKTEACEGFTTEWRANTNTNSRKPKRNVTLKPKRSEGFKEEWSAGERAKRLQTDHKVLLDSVSSSPRTRSVSAKPKRLPQNKSELLNLYSVVSHS